MTDSYLIKTDGTKQDLVPQNGKNFTLQELYSVINCELVEVVRLPKKMIMIVDEEGLLTGQAPNREASQLTEFQHFIVGNAVICPSKMFK